MPNAAIEKGLDQISDEQSAQLSRDYAEKELSAATTRAWYRASLIIKGHGEPKYGHIGNHTPEIPYKRLHEPEIRFKLTGIEPMISQGIPVFREVICFQYEKTADVTNQPHILFKLILNKGVWHDGSEVKTREQITFMDAVIRYVEQGCKEIKPQKAQ